MKIRIPTPAEVKAMRNAAGLTQRECAEIFGYQLRSWQKKEEAGENGRALSMGEWHFLLLIAGEHPWYTLAKKREKNKA